MCLVFFSLWHFGLWPDILLSVFPRLSPRCKTCFCASDTTCRHTQSSHEARCGSARLLLRPCLCSDMHAHRCVCMSLQRQEERHVEVSLHSPSLRWRVRWLARSVCLFVFLGLPCRRREGATDGEPLRREDLRNLWKTIDFLLSLLQCQFLRLSLREQALLKEVTYLFLSEACPYHCCMQVLHASAKRLLSARLLRVISDLKDTLLVVSKVCSCLVHFSLEDLWISSLAERGFPLPGCRDCGCVGRCV